LSACAPAEPFGGPPDFSHSAQSFSTLCVQRSVEPSRVPQVARRPKESLRSDCRIATRDQELQLSDSSVIVVSQKLVVLTGLKQIGWRFTQVGRRTKNDQVRVASTEKMPFLRVSQTLFSVREFLLQIFHDKFRRLLPSLLDVLHFQRANLTGQTPSHIEQRNGKNSGNASEIASTVQREASLKGERLI
jgi:hypothetical protein